MKWNNLVNVGVIVTWHIQGFSARSDMLYSAVHWQVLISLHRKGDLPQVVRLEGSAAIVGGQLLQIHRLSDHSALQQGSGVDHLLQACVSVPLTGASSSHTRACTHTHTLVHTALFSTHSQIPFAHSQWIACCPTVSVHKQFFPSSASPPSSLFLRSSPTPLHMKPSLPI